MFFQCIHITDSAPDEQVVSIESKKDYSSLGEKVPIDFLLEICTVLQNYVSNLRYTNVKCKMNVFLTFMILGGIYIYTSDKKN